MIAIIKGINSLSANNSLQMQQLCQLENAQTEITPLNMYNKFVERIRRNLHVVLAFSPIGDAFRNRLRMFPSLINCCTIDWFQVCWKSAWRLFLAKANRKNVY